MASEEDVPDAPPPARPAKPWEGAGAAASASPTPLSEVLPQAPAAEEPPPREDQVTNAVGFLSHPKVRGSSDASKRAFLQRKGLSQAEIAEAFRRVPPADPASPALAAPAPTPQPSQSLQSPQPQPMAVVQSPPPPQPVRWSQVVLGAGLTALVAVGVRKLLEPYRYQLLHALSRAIAPKEDLAQEDAQAQGAARESEDRKEAALEACVASLEAQTGQLAASVAALTATVSAIGQQPARQDTPTELQATLATLTAALQRLEPAGGGAGELRGEMQEIKSLLSRQRLPQPTALPATGLNQVRPPVDVKGKAPMEPPQSASYQEVLRMLEQGKTPPGIRTDIVDTPPDPTQPPSSSQAAPRRKPWERAAPADTVPGNTGMDVLRQGGAPPPGGTLSLADTPLSSRTSNGSLDAMPGGSNTAQPHSVFQQQAELLNTEPADSMPPPTPNSAVPSSPSEWTPPPRPKPTLPQASYASVAAAAEEPADSPSSEAPAPAADEQAGPSTGP